MRSISQLSSTNALVRLLILALSICSYSAVAADVEVKCSVGPVQESKHFADLQKQSLRLNEETCLALLSDNRETFENKQKVLYSEYGLSVKDAASAAFKEPPFGNVAVPFDQFIDTISEQEFSSKQLPEFNVELSNDATAMHFSFDDPVKRGEIDLANDSSCNDQFQATCTDVLDDFANAVNYYKFSYEKLTAADTKSKLMQLSEQWDIFLDSGRSQTLFDLGLTTVIERRHFKKGYLVGPPRRQWSLLHPNLVYEHVNDAPEGDKDKFSVAIEWIGVNWWGEDSPLFDIPFGVSIASVYSDRSGLESVGHGLMFHFDNKYSIGWSNRSGDSGVYVSLDLLKLVEDKRQQLERYKSEFRSE